MRIYISGKMTGLPDLGFPLFHRAAAQLRATGHEVINPAELDGSEEQQMQWHEYLRRDIAELVKCDAIALLPNWVDSRGAKLEAHIALELGMHLMYLDGED